MAPDVDLEGVARRTPGFTGADLANVLNEAALLTARQNDRMITNAAHGRGHRPGHRRAAEAQPADERAGQADHRLPRGRARPGRGGAAGHRPGAEGDDPAARPGPGLHDGAAGAGQVRQHPRRTAGPARVHDGRPGGRGTGLPRPDHRRQQRHREGHQRGQGDGHPVRHDRADRGRQARHRRRRAVPGPRLRPPARLLRGHRGDRRRGGLQADQQRPPGGVRHPDREPGRAGRPGPGAVREGDAGQGRGGRGVPAAAAVAEAAGLDGLGQPGAVDDPAGHPAAARPERRSTQRPRATARLPAGRRQPARWSRAAAGAHAGAAATSVAAGGRLRAGAAARAWWTAGGATPPGPYPGPQGPPPGSNWPPAGPDYR